MKEIIRGMAYNRRKAQKKEGGMEEMNGTVLEGINRKHKKGEVGRN
jgi:hypothetical protein